METPQVFEVCKQKQQKVTHELLYHKVQENIKYTSEKKGEKNSVIIFTDKITLFP